MRIILNILLIASILALIGLPESFAIAPAYPDSPNEVIYLQTDRDIYMAGEDLFFSVELINFQETEEPLSEIAYLAIRNQHGVIKRTSFSLEKNRFTGSLYLPDTLSTGYIELICFTNWMRNFDEEHFFKKTILVVNRFDKDLNFLKEGISSANSHELGFFPESGKLIQGISQKLLISALPDNQFASAEVTIFSEDGDSIQSARLNNLGWAVLDFFPEPGEAYYGKIKGVEKKFQLPEPEASGYLMKVSQVGENILVEIITNEPKYEDLTLLVSANTSVQSKFPVAISGSTNISIEIPAIDLDQGIYTFLLTNQTGEVNARRNWFLDKRILPSAKVSLNKPVFNERDKVEMQVWLDDPEDAIDWLNISVARLGRKNPQGVNHSSFHLALDLKAGLGISLQESIRLVASSGMEQINDILILPGLPKKNLLVKPAQTKRFFRETSHLTLSGRITEASSGNPVNAARVILNTPDTIVNLQYTNSDSDGFFTFFLSSYYDNREVFLTPDPGTIPGEVRIDVFDKFEFKTPFKPKPYNSGSIQLEAIRESQEILEIIKAFDITTTKEKQETELPAAPNVVFSSPVFTINTDDFIPLNDLQEIAREIIGPWRIRRSRGVTTHSMISRTTTVSMDGVPILFIDGLITYDIEPLLALNSRQIKNIHIHNLEWKHGDMHFPGTAAIFTRNQEYLILDLKPKPAKIFNPAHRFRERFVPPEHNEPVPENNLPDLRELLYWFSGKPDTQNGTALFSWFTSDLNLEYSVSIEGVTKKGHLVKIETKIKTGE